MDIRTLLVATDFSADSDAALEHAVELARVLGARLHVLHAYFVMIPALPHDHYAIPEEVVASVRASAQARLEAVEKRLEQRAVAAQTHLVSDDAVRAILELARSLPAELIVMGTRGLTGLKHVLLGSVAERTVRLAPCPVMTVKAKDR